MPGVMKKIGCMYAIIFLGGDIYVWYHSFSWGELIAFVGEEIWAYMYV